MSPEDDLTHAAILEMPYHKYVVSEFDPTCGRCDKCGGSEGADVHQKPVDQMARIADALDTLANGVELGFPEIMESLPVFGRIADALERIAAHLESVRDQAEYALPRAALALERIAVGEKGPYTL